MLLKQGTDLCEEIKTLIKDSDSSSSFIYKCTNNLRVDSIRNHPQTKYQRSGLVKLLVMTKLMDISSIHNYVHEYLNHFVSVGKDVFYKVRNSSYFNWRQMLLYSAQDSLRGIEVEDSTQANKQSCFIIDDSDLPKRGRTMELIGKIFSHISGRCHLGYKCLNLAYWSGKHLVHVDFSLHIETTKKGNQGMSQKDLAKRYEVKRSVKSYGNLRIKEAVMKKTDSAIKMMKRAIGKGIKASYILADSWFFNSKLVKFAKSKNLTLISRPKLNNWTYQYKSKDYTLGQLIKKFSYAQSKKWSRELRMHYVRVPVTFQGESVVLFFYKPKKRGTKWHVLVTTGTKIGAIQAYKTYQNRWAIEVSYKELKQHLGLGKCQSRNFNAQIADTTFTLMAYNALSHSKAIENYQSIGQLFEHISRNWLTPTLMERYWKYIYDLLHQICEMFEIDINTMVERLIYKDDFFKILSNFYPNFTTET